MQPTNMRITRLKLEMLLRALEADEAGAARQAEKRDRCSLSPRAGRVPACESVCEHKSTLEHATRDNHVAARPL